MHYTLAPRGNVSGRPVLALPARRSPGRVGEERGRPASPEFPRARTPARRMARFRSTAPRVVTRKYRGRMRPERMGFQGRS